MSKTLVAIVAKDQNFAISADDIEAFYTRCPAHVGSTTIHKISGNSKPLPIVYNSILDGDLAEGKDFIVLMHADVSLQLESLLAHIEQCKDRYDIMGLCGCSKITLSRTPLNWYNGSALYPESRWGCVTHGEVGDKMSFFSSHSPDVMDHPASCIDGLCIVLSRKAIDVGLRFDEALHFNCYDTQISLDAVLNKDLRLGVLVQKDLYHYSIGKQIHSEDFMKDELELRRRFSLDVPKGSMFDAYQQLTSASLQ